ncbi:DNA translocase FtsK-like isoform X2 [Athalia rosae]|uniref:DNA translocase FtsK-like isoform X2 n=1 Tax=Athalia rosae TaxID=37344 RepID=UPI0020347253|nr:DNA translocase FtsK-like isoform X2 [Athalia rosae]
MDRSSFLGKYSAVFLLLGVWSVVVVAADPVDHGKSRTETSDEDFDTQVARRSTGAGVAQAKDAKPNSGPTGEGQQDDESYRRFLVNALMGMKQQQWGWVGASTNTQGQQPQQQVYNQAPQQVQKPVYNPTPQVQQPVYTSPQVQQSQQPVYNPPQVQQQQQPVYTAPQVPVQDQPSAPQLPPPPPPPPTQAQQVGHQPPSPSPQQAPQQPQISSCPQYSVMPQAPPPPMQSYTEKFPTQYGQCVTVVLPSPVMGGYKTMTSTASNADDTNNAMQQPCRNGCSSVSNAIRTLHPPRRGQYY